MLQAQATRTPFIRTMRHILFVVVFISFSACSSVIKVEHASKLQEAQDLFNEAADMENMLRADPLAGGSVAPSSRIDATYRTAHAMVKSLIQEQGEALKSR